MASWGVAPGEVAHRFSEEALLELVPALVERRMDDSFAAQLALIAKAMMPGASSSSAMSGVLALRKYRSGRTGRVYGSAQRPLTGAELEWAFRDLAKHEQRVKVH